MALRYDQKQAFSIVGMKYVGTNQNQEVGALWDRFIPRMGEIAAEGNGIAYGYCWVDESCREGEFAYVAGLESSGPVPEGMVRVEVPASRYAVYTHVGPVTSLPKAFETAYQEVREAGQTHGDYAFELYPSDFDDSANSRVEIWIPLK